MKVVFLLTQARGGPVDLTVSLAKELAGRPDGPDVTILGPAPASGAELPPGMHRAVHIRSKTDARGFAAVSKWLDRLAPDIVHAQDRRAGLVSALIARKRVPVVMTFHGVPDNAAGRWVQCGPLQGRWPGISGGSRLVADALVARRVGYTVAPSRAMGEFLRRELRVPANRLRVVPNGVAVPEQGKQLNGIRTFTTVSSFAPCKAMPVLVEAFVDLAADNPGVRLRMVGDGFDRRRCEEIAQRAAGGSNIEFVGFRTDVEAQLGQADVFVLPSLNENLPLALLQAMAMGLPCISSGVGGIPEILDADCGIFVAPGDAGSLRAAMKRMLNEPSLAADFGAKARSRIAESYSLSRCADDHLRLWSEILGKAAIKIRIPGHLPLPDPD